MRHIVQDWAPANSGFGPMGQSPQNLAYLQGQLTQIAGQGGGDDY